MDEDSWQTCQYKYELNTQTINDRFLCVFHFTEEI